MCMRSLSVISLGSDLFHRHLAMEISIWKYHVEGQIYSFHPWCKSLPKRSSRVEVTQWRELLCPFVGVKNVYMFETIAFHIAYSFQALGVGV